MFKDKSALEIFGLLLALGAGIMLLLSLASSGFRDALINFGVGMANFREYRMEFLGFIFAMMVLIGIGSLIFSGKK